MQGRSKCQSFLRIAAFCSWRSRWRLARFFRGGLRCRLQNSPRFVRTFCTFWVVFCRLFPPANSMRVAWRSPYTHLMRIALSASLAQSAWSFLPSFYAFSRGVSASFVFLSLQSYCVFLLHFGHFCKSFFAFFCVFCAVFRGFPAAVVAKKPLLAVASRQNLLAGCCFLSFVRSFARFSRGFLSAKTHSVFALSRHRRGVREAVVATL